MKAMNMKKTIIFAAAALLMGSCGLYNKYERPEVNTKGLIRDVASSTDTLVVTNTDSNFGDMPWRTLFTDATLQQHIQQALEHNTDLLNAALNVQAAEAQLKASKLAFLPSLTFAPQGTLASFDWNKPTKTYLLPVQASWNVDLFGQLLSSKRSTQMQLLMAKDYQVSVQTSIVCNVANMYYTLMMLDRQLQIVTDMSALMKDTWDMMKLQMELGRTRSTSVQSAESRYYGALAQAEDLKRQIRETENSFCLLLGEPAHQVARTTLEEQSMPSSFATGVGIQLLTNRADVHAAEMQLASCFYDIQTARSRFYPQLNITGALGFTNNSGAGIVNPGKFLANVVGQLTQPIFARGQIIAGLKVAKVQYEKAFNSWQNAILKAGNEVSNALVLYNTSDTKAQLEQQQVAVLEKNVEDTRMLYKSSGSSYLEVITAQTDLLNARLSKVQDDFYKMQSVVSLYQALGGGGK